MLLFVVQLVGIVAFAASGALAAVRARLDVFGIVVLALTTALGGGIIRDVLLGVHPPETLRTWPYLLVATVTGLIAVWFHPQLARLRWSVLVADAVGLGLFVTAGTATALAHELPAYSACLVGMTAGIGGGAMRDILLRQIPLVLRREIYALAALAGAVVVVCGAELRLPEVPVTLVGSVLVVALRLLAIWRNWNAPTARRPPP
ncbi:trimeric intracellular cation channel family protein [Goodfellowiella coeruleoviolacea]|uniref:Membrane protein YeiH n=1 Tax=Goodfellowiella coeruleoviolacea TaxID=334858 RepID=A0AAE3GIB0_9PSEU|nr:trimeric intracellular cation channel family protein [Goodfellowiella coeruleoviolacea]MCP2168686.1 putative membrane protein YeiH [Goodfellowiella coeruleoviolacea]